MQYTVLAHLVKVARKYLEASFVTDVQHYPETKDSYYKIYDEAEKALGVI